MSDLLVTEGQRHVRWTTADKEPLHFPFATGHFESSISAAAFTWDG